MSLLVTSFFATGGIFMDEWKLEDTYRILEPYKDKNPLPTEKQDQQAYIEIAHHVFSGVSGLTMDEVRSVVATANYMYLRQKDKQAFIGKIAAAYNIKTGEILAWEKAINEYLEEPVIDMRRAPFKQEEAFSYLAMVMSRYDSEVQIAAEQLLRRFLDVYPITIKRNVNYQSIVGAVEYATIVNCYSELKDFDQQQLADKYGVSRTSIAVWYRNIKKYCVQEAWH